MVRWLHRFGLWAANAVIFQHQAAPDSIFGKELANHYRHKFTSIIPGVDLSVLDSFRRVRECKKKGKEEPFKLLQVGTLCDRKNQMLLLDALHCLKSKTLANKIHVQLAGGLSDGLYVKKIIDAIEGKGLEGSVELLGWRDDVHELMVEADLLVMPSKDEGVPNTVQEAMYIGLPVIVSDAGGMPEVVKNGQTGWVLSLNDSVEWGRQIECCIEERERVLMVGKMASIYAAKNFGTMEWGRRYSNVIQSVLRDKKT
jgi:glycosyltransferase involved in cell wall biosynthesis